MKNPFKKMISYIEHRLTLWQTNPKWLEGITTYVHYDVSQETLDELEKILDEYREKIGKKSPLSPK